MRSGSVRQAVVEYLTFVLRSSSSRTRSMRLIRHHLARCGVHHQRGRAFYLLYANPLFRGAAAAGPSVRAARRTPVDRYRAGHAETPRSPCYGR